MRISKHLIPRSHKTASLVFAQALCLVSVQRGLTLIRIIIFGFQFSLRHNHGIILRLIDDKRPHLVCFPVFHPYELRGIAIGPKTWCIHGTAGVVPLAVSNFGQNLLNFLVLTFDYFILFQNSFIDVGLILAQTTTYRDTEDNENQKDDDDSHQKQKVFTVVEKLGDAPFFG